MIFYLLMGTESVDLPWKDCESLLDRACGAKNWMKRKSPGGYPTLAHAGLSLLEVWVPWVEIQKGI